MVQMSALPERSEANSRVAPSLDQVTPPSSPASSVSCFAPLPSVAIIQTLADPLASDE